MARQILLFREHEIRENCGNIYIDFDFNTRHGNFEYEGIVLKVKDVKAAIERSDAAIQLLTESAQNAWIAKLYELNLGEAYTPNTEESWVRVPGGWIYTSPKSSVFIPFNNEGQIVKH